MTLGTQISNFRKQQGITQEALAQQLGITNQAVSKWESDQCCPDVTLLPKLADIFGISLDTLFGRETPHAPTMPLPWADDGVLRAVLFVGRQLIDGHPAAQEITFQYEGDALNIESAFSVTCEDVEGNIHAGGSVSCADVDGNVDASGSVSCGDVAGNVNAGGNASCGDIDGNLKAGGNVNCGDVAGDVQAGGMASCGDVSGSVNSGKDAMAKMWQKMMPNNWE